MERAKRAVDESVYQSQDAIAKTIKAVAVTGGAGLLISAVQNTLKKQNVSAWGVFTKTGGTVAMFAFAGGAYEFSKIASANLRRSDDSINAGIGGFMAGAVVGLRARSIPSVLGYGAAFAVALTVFDYGGGKLTGFDRDPNEDQVARVEALRKNRRRPMEETLEEIGEGRGIYPPGYAERRRQRLLEKYGVDVGER